MAGTFDAAALLREARLRAGLSQRALARRVGTAQSVVARIESARTSPTTDTLVRLLAAMDVEIRAEIVQRPTLDETMLADVPRILRLTPDERLREVGNVSRFVTTARRV